MRTREVTVTNSGLQGEITQFLFHEAYLLDSKRFEEWLDLLADDLVYRMPLRVTTENKDGTNVVEDMAFFEETKKSLTTRVNRLRTTTAWAENPAPRTRRFISNIMIEDVANSDELRVRSYFLFLRSRAGDIAIEQLFGERQDILRKTDGGWKIARRIIYPDQAVLGVNNLSMFL
jgi:3-phenylpropionate/cinnamic acid dioxygenase small subunit